MLLILNLIVDKNIRDSFDKSNIARIVSNLKIKYEINYLETSDLDLAGFTHLLLTGSELSASKKNNIDEQLYKVIDHFVQKGKSILGICYGHQMLAKALYGESACRRTKKPEFGWKNIEIVPNPLFVGIRNPIFMESHYDEVCNLDNDFQIIAKNDDCEIQAFQYKNLPIWGIQFHPEFLWEDGEKLMQNHLNDNLDDRVYYKNEMDSSEILEQNFKIFENFIHNDY
ncbi:MAG: gamma-glutamyl-gamma-aminobutyrate hydrolase family protein [Candidatus Cloacimonetes bacterium]|nr:gamma-glutamyl-gamma-aminobutyrate hydrolase family protein [Candidatus Cloacimonadota bacterium]